MVKIPVAEQDGFNGRSSGLRRRLTLKVDQLRPEVWRRIHQYPAPPDSADGDTTLASWFDLSPSRGITLAARTIPLRDSAAGSRSQYLDYHRLAPN
jgi:hypothetical protein